MFFGSDNQSGASPQILEMLLKANQGFFPGYGNDEWTKHATAELKRIFECDLEAFFVSTGTAANCLALSSLTQPWESILCHGNSHLWVDESTGPEFYSGGARLVPISSGEAKLSSENIEHFLQTVGRETPHNSLVKTLSITQSSENGLVYSSDEIAACGNICDHYDLKFHSNCSGGHEGMRVAGSKNLELRRSEPLCLTSRGLKPY